MFKPIRELSKKWQFFDIVNFTIGFRIKKPIDNNIAMKGIIKIGNLFPELASDSESEENTYILNNRAIIGNNYNNLIQFSLNEYQKIGLTLGINYYILDFRSSINKFLEIIQNDFEIYPINIKDIATKISVISSWQGNHYKVIFDTFLKNSPLTLLEPENILEDGLIFRSIIDDKRESNISINSTLGDAEVRKSDYIDDIMFAECMVNQTSGIPINANLLDVFLEHSDIAFKFFEEKFIPAVIEPLDKTTLKLSKENTLDGNC